MYVNHQLILVALASAMFTGCATKEPSPAAPPVVVAGARQLAVEISTENGITEGSAAWIKPGVVLTASHLFLGMSEKSTIRVGSGRKWGRATIVAIDDPAYRDLALLKVDPEYLTILAPPTQPITLCNAPIQSSQQVLVASGLTNTVSSSYGSPEMLIHNKGKSWSEHLTGYYAHGTSGAAIYDADSGCLGGVISKRHKNTSNSDLKVYSTEFVALPQIVDFLNSHMQEIY
jgi:hypothetical protein